jgi:hypothetical protein
MDMAKVTSQTLRCQSLLFPSRFADQKCRNLDGKPEEPHSYVLAAELGSMSLEFTKLSQITGDPRYFDAVQRIADVMEREQSETKIPGLWPIVFNAQSQSFRDDATFTMGGRADSMYEYVPKVSRPEGTFRSEAKIS